MIHRSTKTITVISIIVFLVSVAVCTGFAYMIVLKKATSSAAADARAQEQADVQERALLNKQYDENSEDRQSLFTRILPDEQVIDFLALVETIGKEQGVGLTTNTLSTIPINNFFEILDVRMTVEGDYDKLSTVLKILENLPYQVGIKSVQLSRDDETWKGTYELQVTKFKKI